MGDINATLEERGGNYGSFRSNARTAQDLKHTASNGANSSALMDYQAEALDMILHKVARIVNGNPNYADSWHDIAGYATLVVKELEAK